MTLCYSPGAFYECPKCHSELIRFVFDVPTKDLTKIFKQIWTKKVTLFASFDDYKKHDEALKWICKECFDCGIVVLSKS